MAHGLDAVKNLNEDLPLSMAIAGLSGVSWYIVLELVTHMYYTFKRKNGMYFWACVVSVCGIFLSPLFNILKDYGVWKSESGTIIMVVFSWWIMVIPQSVVLYSRLHLVTRNKTILRFVFWMIVTTAITISIPTVIWSILSRTTLKRQGSSYLIWDKVQLTIFFLQETIISIIYIVQTKKRLNATSVLRSEDANKRPVLWDLIFVNVIIIALDIILQTLSFMNYFYVVSAVKVCVYAVKLRIEFAILNRLIETVQSGRRTGNHTSSGGGIGSKYFPGGTGKRAEMQLDEFDRRSQQSEAQILGETHIHGSVDETARAHAGFPPGNNIVKTTEIRTYTGSDRAV